MLSMAIELGLENGVRRISFIRICVPKSVLGGGKASRSGGKSN